MFSLPCIKHYNRKNKQDLTYYGRIRAALSSFHIRNLIWLILLTGLIKFSNSQRTTAQDNWICFATGRCYEDAHLLEQLKKDQEQLKNISVWLKTQLSQQAQRIKDLYTKLNNARNKQVLTVNEYSISKELKTTTKRTIYRQHMNLALTADNLVLSFSIDGKAIPENWPSDPYAWMHAKVIKVSGKAQVLATKLRNYWGPAGFLASSSDGWILTNSSWKCCSASELTGDLEWTSIGYDDSKWPQAVEHERNGGSIHGRIYQIHSSAFWIWTANNLIENNTIACRYTIPQQ